MDLPITPDPLIGASCALGTEELRRRIAEWRALRDSALRVESRADAMRLSFAAERSDLAVEAARLAALESECCPFYRFTLRVDGPRRELDIDAGPGRRAAVEALLGLTA